MNETEKIDLDTNTFDDEPRYEISVASSRGITQLFELSDLEDINEALSPDDNLITLFIRMHEIDYHGKRKDEMLECKLTLLKDMFSKEESFYAFDERSQEHFNYYKALSKTGIFNEDFDDDNEDFWDYSSEYGVNIANGVMERLYINPKYRGNNLATLILNNLRQIVLHSTNLAIRGIVTYPKPDDGQSDDMKDIMIKTIKNCKFNEIPGEKNYYFRDY